jgi:hypothetical protein
VALDAAGLRVVEGVAATVQVQLPGSLLVAGDWKSVRQGTEHNGKKDLPTMIGHVGRNLEMRRAVLPLVVSTTIALAFCSLAAATAAIATVSVVSVG